MSTSTSQPRKSSAPRHVEAKGAELTSPKEHRVQVAAARLRVTLDGRLNRTTPPEVKALAKEEL